MTIIWEKISDVPLLGRCSHTAIWTGEKMIVWGGVDRNTHYADGPIYEFPKQKK